MSYNTSGTIGFPNSSTIKFSPLNKKDNTVIKSKRNSVLVGGLVAAGCCLGHSAVGFLKAASRAACQHRVWPQTALLKRDTSPTRHSVTDHPKHEVHLRVSMSCRCCASGYPGAGQRLRVPGREEKGEEIGADYNTTSSPGVGAFGAWSEHFAAGWEASAYSEC